MRRLRSICYNILSYRENFKLRGETMDAMMKMWVSFAGIILLIIAVIFISLSRYKLKGWISKIVAFIAYISLIIGALIIFYIVFSGPSD